MVALPAAAQRAPVPVSLARTPVLIGLTSWRVPEQLLPDSVSARIAFPAQALPERGDHAWEGLLVGAAVGTALGLLLNVAWEGMAEEGRSVREWVGGFLLPQTVTLPLGLMIGSAIPNRVQPQAGGG